MTPSTRTISRRSDPVACAIGAVASEHERNTRLVVSLVRGLGGLGDQFPIKNRRGLERLNAAARLRRRAANNLFGTEGAQLPRMLKTLPRNRSPGA